jgi:phage tail-like protein
VNASITSPTARRLTWALSLTLAGVVVALSLQLQRPAASQVNGITARLVDGSGQVIGTFTGLEIVSEVQPSDYLSTTEKGPLLSKTFGKAKSPMVTLHRVLPPAKDQALAVWHDAARSGQPAARRDATLTLNTGSGAPIVAFRLVNAWPSKLEVAVKSQVVVETVVLITDQVQRAAP